MVSNPVSADGANLPDNLGDLAREINGILEREAEVGTQFDDELNKEVEEHCRRCEDIKLRKDNAIKDLRLEAGHLLIAAKTKVTSGKWREWLHENIQRGVSDCYQCMKMAGADDPDKEREKEKERAREGMRKTRESRKPPVSVTSPVTDIPAPGSVTLPKGIVQNAPLRAVIYTADPNADFVKPQEPATTVVNGEASVPLPFDAPAPNTDAEAAALAALEASQTSWAPPTATYSVTELAPEAMGDASDEDLAGLVDVSSPALDAFKATFEKLDNRERIIAREWINEQGYGLGWSSDPYLGVHPKRRQVLEWVNTFRSWHYLDRYTARQVIFMIEDDEGPESASTQPTETVASEVDQPAEPPPEPPMPPAMALAMAPDDRITAPADETEPELLSSAARDALRKLKEYAKANAAPWLNFTQCEDRGISEDAIEELLRAGLIIHPPGNENVVGIEPGWMRKERLARERASSAETA